MTPVKCDACMVKLDIPCLDGGGHKMIVCFDCDPPSFWCELCAAGHGHGQPKPKGAE